VNTGRFAQRFPSWNEHAGAAIFSVGALNCILVVSGFGITWLSMLKRYELECRVQRLQGELARTECQLEHIYGPLRAITHATEVGFRSFVSEHTPSRKADSESTNSLEVHLMHRPHSRECRRYRDLVACTLQPLNRRAMEIILNNTHLIDGEFPECLYSLYSHVIEMDSLLERWRHRDFSRIFPITGYPTEVNVWAGREFERLRHKQTKLIMELDGRDSVPQKTWSDMLLQSIR